MRSTYDAAIVRICRPDGTVEGTGFLVTPHLVATCAHVIEACGGWNSVSVQFYVDPHQRVIPVTIAEEFWRPSNQDDVAILRLRPDSELPARATPVQLASTRGIAGHVCQVMGFPDLPGYEAVSIQGRLEAVVPHAAKHPMLQVAIFATFRGMSGAPVFDRDMGCVVGLLSEAYEGQPLQWATTSDTLATICPEIHLGPAQAIQDYLDSVRAYCASLPYLSLQSAPTPSHLDDVYVPLRARVQVRPETGPTDGSVLTAANRQIVSIAEVLRQTQPVQHLLLFGDPGSGKTTLLRQIAERAWHQPGAVGLAEPHLPLIAPLRLLAEFSGSVDGRLRQAVETELVLNEALPSGFFGDWPDATGSRWLIMLDALDEVPKAQRPEILRWLRAVLRDTDRYTVVLTSRRFSVTPQEMERLPLRWYEVQPFSAVQARDFARKWLGQQAPVFLREVDRLRIGELRGTPLILTIAARVFAQVGHLPERRATLYRQFINLWMEEAETRGLLRELSPRFVLFAQLAIAHVATTLAAQGSLASDQAITTELAHFLQSATYVAPMEAFAESRLFLQVMTRRSGFLMQRGDAVHFLHPTFQEYLAAFFAVETGQHDLAALGKDLAAGLSSPTASEIALFALGILADAGRDCMPVALPLLEQGDRGLSVLANAMIEEIVLADSLRARVIDLLVEWARRDSPETVASQAHPVAFLESLCVDPRARQGLVDLVHDTRVPATTRLNAVEALGIRDARLELIELVTNQALDVELRSAANQALHIAGHDDLLGVTFEDKPGSAATARPPTPSSPLRVQASSLLEELVLQEDLDRKSRLEAVALLAERQCAQQLVDMSRHDTLDIGLRQHIANSLAMWGHSTAAIQAWTAIAQDPSVRADNRLAAAHVLIESGAQEVAAESLSALLAEPGITAWLRADATIGLWTLTRSTEALDSLRTLAVDPLMTDAIRFRVFDSLRDTAYGAEALGGLSRLAQDGVTEEVLVSVAETYWRLGRHGNAVDVFSRLAEKTSGNPRIRFRCADALQRLGRPELGAAVWLGLATDSQIDEILRRESAMALERHHHEKAAIEAWWSIACDEQIWPAARCEAIQALGTSAAPVDLLVRLLTALKPSVQDEAIRRAVGSIVIRLTTVGEAEPELTQLYDIEPIAEELVAFAEAGQTQAVKVLDQWGRIQELLALAQQHRAPCAVRLAAARALGHQGRIGEAIESLSSLRNDPIGLSCWLDVAATLREWGLEAEADSTLDRAVRFRDAPLKERWRAVESIQKRESLMQIALDETLEPDIRIRACSQLIALKQMKAATVGLLRVTLGKGLNAKERVEVARCLHLVDRDLDALRILTEIASDDAHEAEDRLLASQGLAQMGERQLAASSCLSVLAKPGNDVNRFLAVEGLRQLGQEAAALTTLVRIVGQALRNQEEDQIAAVAIRQIGNLRGVEPLVNVLGLIRDAFQSSNRDTFMPLARRLTRAVCVELIRLNETAFLAALARQSRWPIEVRVFVIEHLAGSTDGTLADQALMDLAKSIDHHIPAGRLEIARALINLHHKDQGIALLTTMAGDAGIRAADRFAIAIELARVEQYDIAWLVLKAVVTNGHADLAERVEALHALSEWGQTDLLKELVLDPTLPTQIREEAVIQLGERKRTDDLLALSQEPSLLPALRLFIVSTRLTVCDRESPDRLPSTQRTLLRQMASEETLPWVTRGKALKLMTSEGMLSEASIILADMCRRSALPAELRFEAARLLAEAGLEAEACWGWQALADDTTVGLPLRVEALSRMGQGGAAQAVALKGWLQHQTETFTNNQWRWPEGVVQYDKGLVNRDLGGGKYTWTVSTTSSISVSARPDLLDRSSFCVTVAATVTESVEDASYGVVFRDNPAGYYLFGVRNDSYYLDRIVDHNRLGLINRTSSQYIRPGKPNRLTVIALGAHFIFLINGLFVAAYQDEIHRSGAITLFASLNNRSKRATVAFTRVELWAP